MFFFVRILKGAFPLPLFFGIGKGTEQDFCHVSMPTTYLDDGIMMRLCTVPSQKCFFADQHGM